MLQCYWTRKQTCSRAWSPVCSYVSMEEDVAAWPDVCHGLSKHCSAAPVLVHIGWKLYHVHAGTHGTHWVQSVLCGPRFMADSPLRRKAWVKIDASVGSTRSYLVSFAGLHAGWPSWPTMRQERRTGNKVSHTIQTGCHNEDKLN